PDDARALLEPQASLCVRDRRRDVQTELAALLDDRAARVAQADQTRIVVLVRGNAEPGRPARPLGDRLRKVVLVPGRRPRDALIAVLVNDPRLAAPELREAHVVGLVDLRRRC